jgi:hypothetical protein
MVSREHLSDGRDPLDLVDLELKFDDFLLGKDILARAI